MSKTNLKLLSGNEAVALGALEAGITLGTGYAGTPSTEILEVFSALGGKAQWAPNEKVALEVAVGAAYARARSLVTMKHVGLNVAADPLFSATYAGVDGAMIVVSADDPGMASSQNEQDNRNYAPAAVLPMLEPSDSQEAYDFVHLAVEISERWHIPILFRMTTRICHSKTVVRTGPRSPWKHDIGFVRDISWRVMTPANAGPAHRRLREKLSQMSDWSEKTKVNFVVAGDKSLGIIASGVAYAHAREAAPNASFLKLGFTHPLPLKKIRDFAKSVSRCVVIEEGDPYLANAIRTKGIKVESKDEMYRFGELNVARVRRILSGDTSPEIEPPRGKSPQLCPGCPHRKMFEILRDLDCIVAGDIGCYTLGVMPPFESIDTCICMGASIGIGLGLRHVLPDEQARKVVSVIGDSTFAHSGLTGIVEMVYNPPPTGHVVVILDNRTTAMTGMQENPGTGRRLDHSPTHRVVFEEVVRAIGVPNVYVVDPIMNNEELRRLVEESLHLDELTVIVARRPCLLAAGKIKQYENENEKE